MLGVTREHHLHASMSWPQHFVRNSAKICSTNDGQTLIYWVSSKCCLQVVLGAKSTILQNKPLIWVENEAYFDDPPNRTFVESWPRVLLHHAVRLQGNCKIMIMRDFLLRKWIFMVWGIRRIYLLATASYSRIASAICPGDSVWTAVNCQSPPHLNTCN